MRAFGVKPNEVVEQFIVEQINVCKQQVFVVSREFILDAAVEAFHMGIHFGGLGIGQPAAYPILRHLGIKCGFELATVIRQHPFNFIRETCFGKPPQYRCPFAALVGADKTTSHSAKPINDIGKPLVMATAAAARLLMSVKVLMYRRCPSRCISIVSTPTHCPG